MICVFHPWHVPIFACSAGGALGLRQTRGWQVEGGHLLHRPSHWWYRQPHSKLGRAMVTDGWDGDEFVWSNRRRYRRSMKFYIQMDFERLHGEAFDASWWNTYIGVYIYPQDPCMLYMVTWIPSIYPLYVSIYTSTMDPMGYDLHLPSISPIDATRKRGQDGWCWLCGSATGPEWQRNVLGVRWPIRDESYSYPLVNIHKAMENHHF